MSRYMRYRVPIVDSEDGYVISNCYVYGHYEMADRLIGDVKLPPIVMYGNGTLLKDINDCTSSDTVPKSVWKRAIRGNSTKNWFLTSVRINHEGIDFFFSYKNDKKAGRKVSIKTTKDMRIWIYVPRVPRDTSLPDESYLIESVYDASMPASRGDGYRIKVTEFFRCMIREICIIGEQNPYFNPLIHNESLQTNYFLLITEIENQDA
ncbi:hypothetical protein [Dehalobacter restrictus]|uniref:hypothetical protein n=1 Tax=Dehalobacter restrictus TaxID=55583 RepID=UPI00338FA1A3